MTANVRIRHGALALLAGALLLAAQTAAAQSGPLRIVVLPFYTEEGTDVTDAGYEARHYRRIIRFINNQLVRHGFEVISSHAKELKEQEYNRLRERAREDSSLAAQEMTRKYAVDVAYVVWLDVSRRTTGDGYCRAKARVEGEGYDSGARDIGAGVIKTFTLTRRDCDDAVIEAEKEVGGRGRAHAHRLAGALRRAPDRDVRDQGRRRHGFRWRRRDRDQCRCAREPDQLAARRGDGVRAGGGVRQGAAHGARRDRGDRLPDHGGTREPAGEPGAVSGAHRGHDHVPVAEQHHDDAEEHLRGGGGISC